MKVLVIGDVMIDSYMWGVTERISPEADVDILDVSKSEMRLGGAGNVALNLKSLSCNVSIFGLFGKDHYLDRFKDLFDQSGISKDFMLCLEGRINTVKTRLIADNKHVIRIDEEEILYLSEEEEKQAIGHLEKCLELDWDLILFEDYNKGLLSPGLIKAAVKLAQEKGIKTIVDPKKENVLAYKGVDLFKPNLKELFWALGEKSQDLSVEQIKNLASKFLQQTGFKKLLLTLSEKGMLIASSDSIKHIPAFQRNIIDVSGAGDTVVSVAGTALAAGLPDAQICLLANLAGGLVCEYPGVVPVDLTKLMSEAKIYAHEY